MNALTLALAFALIGDDSFPARERGSAVLRRLVLSDPGFSGPVAARAADGHPDAEVRSRAGRVTGIYRQWVADSYVPSTCPVWPCIDSIPIPAPDRWEIGSDFRTLARDSTDQQQPTGSPCWWEWRKATELYVRRKLRDEWSPTDADAFLARTWAAEIQWNADHDHRAYAIMAGWTRWDGGYPKPTH